jgi:nicotinate-nucleotide adenylyltransferase
LLQCGETPDSNRSPDLRTPLHLRRRFPPPRLAPARSAAPPPRQRARRGRRIGLLGGSFNPAHQGHLHISLLALKRLGLDEVWWMVSPQNPLKPSDGMAPFAERLADASRLARHPRIRVSAIEAKLGTTYTAETLKRLTRRFPRDRFVWLMGADNLAQIDRWKDWQEIFNTVPVAVFARPSYCLRALAAKAARRFAGRRLAEAESRRLPGREPPAWLFLAGPLNPQSATAIRAARHPRRSEGARERGKPKGVQPKGERQATGRRATAEG